MTAAEINREIEQARKQLGQTVEELAARADVKARASAKAAALKARARDRAAVLSEQVKQSRMVQRRWPLVAAAGVLVAGSAVLVWTRRKT